MLNGLVNARVVLGANSRCSTMDGRLQFHETAEGFLKVLPTDRPAVMSWRLKLGAEQPDHACKIIPVRLRTELNRL